MPSTHITDANIQPTGPQGRDGHERFADLETVELELAIDRQYLEEFGFEHCLQRACAATDFEFLFQLPVFDHIPGQRIAVLSTRKDDSAKLLFAVLNDAGNAVDIVPADEMRAEIRSFAIAFMDVFTQLGRPEAPDN